MKDFSIHTIRLNENDISYLKRGMKGPTIFFIHGLGIDHSIWERVISFLNSSQTLILFDLPGYGLNAHLHIDPRFKNITCFIEDVIREIKTVDYVVSYSLSGVYGYEIARRAKLDIKKMFVVSSPLFDSKRPNKFRILFRFVSLHPVITSVVNFLITRYPVKQLIFYLGRLASIKNPKAMDDCMTFFDKKPNSAYVFRCASGVFRQSSFDSVNIPVEFIYGQNDGFATVSMAKRAMSICKMGTMHVVPDTYHLIPLEHPEKLGSLIQAGCE